MFCPPHSCAGLFKQVVLHWALKIGSCKKFVPQRQSRPNSIPKYLYGASGTASEGIVQKLIGSSVRHMNKLSHTRVGRLHSTEVNILFAALL